MQLQPHLITVFVAIALSFRVNKTALTVIGGALAFAVGFPMRDLPSCRAATSTSKSP
ncbi:MAG: hypothetical protein JRI68_35735 [Deltaproteobacteria bacterium]|nr:hypothetical protein [Deltaproteobacteria bacterium]